MVTTTRKKELLKKEREHLFRNFGVIGANSRIIWEGGQGAILWDIDGKKYIDVSSGQFQCLHLGYGRKELIDAAKQQMDKISFMATGAIYGNEVAIEYASELAEVLPGNLNHVMFTNGGTESTEGAIKAARMYWGLKGKATKYKILCLSDGWHGASHFAASLAGTTMARDPFGFEYPGVVRIPHYHCYRCPYELKYPSCGILCARMVERIIQQEGANSICCMIAEPVQGLAGFIWPPDEYWPMVTKILKKYEILFIADEVQNGFCRTGKFFAVNHWDVVPDMMTMGKGINSNYLPLGAVGVSDCIYQTLDGQPWVAGATSHGNPVVLATARAALKVYREEKMDERSAKLGKHIRERLIKEFLPLPCVDDVMGQGCYHSFAIALNKTTGHPVSPEMQSKVGDETLSRFLEAGVMSRIEWGRRVAVIPPLIIDEKELDKALDIMRDIIKEIKPV